MDCNDSSWIGNLTQRATHLQHGPENLTNFPIQISFFFWGGGGGFTPCATCISSVFSYMKALCQFVGKKKNEEKNREAGEPQWWLPLWLSSMHSDYFFLYFIIFVEFNV